MADGGIIKELFVAVGYKLDEGSERRFSSSVKDASINVAGLNKTLEATGKGVIELGRRFTQLSQQPVKDYTEATKKMQRGHEDLAKSFLELSKVGVAATTALIGAMGKTAQQYASLYYLSQQTSTPVTALKNLQFGFEAIGRSAEEATASFSSFVETLKLPQGEALFKSIVRPEDIQADKALFGDLWETLGKERQEYETSIQTLARIERQQGRNAAIAYGEQFGRNILLNDQLKRNEQDRVKAERERQELVRKGGIDEQKMAAAAAETHRKFGLAVESLSLVWEQAFIDLEPHVERFLKALEQIITFVIGFNERNPWAASVEGFALMAGGAAALLGALNLLLMPFRLLIGFGSGVLALARWFGLIAPAATAAATAATTPATAMDVTAAAQRRANDALNKGVGFLRGLGAAYLAYKAAQAVSEATPEELRPGSPAAKKKEADLTKSLDEMTGGLFSGVFGWAQRQHEKLFAPIEPPETPPLGGPRRQRPPTDYEEQPPARYQGGGIVRIDAHDQEMVLPANISRGLQSLFAADKPKTAGDPEDKRTSESLSSWLRGSAAMVPRIVIENIDDFVQQLIRGLKGEKDKEGGGTGAGGGEGTGAGGGAGGPGGEMDKPGEFTGTGKGHGSDLAKQAMQYFTSQGWTHEQAAGIAANIERESS
jgi:hypothetical protein